MNCSNCSFARSYMSFGHETSYGIKCQVAQEPIFQINEDEARMTSVELLGDYQDERWHVLSVERDSFDRLLPGPFGSWGDDWMEERVEFVKHAILEPQECFCSAGDIADHIQWLTESTIRLRVKLATLKEEETDNLQDLDTAAVLLQALQDKEDKDGIY